MGKDADESHGGARARVVRGLRDIRTLGSLRLSTSPVRTGSSLASRLDLRIGVGPAERAPRRADQSAERPRAWVFVKRPRFARHQGTLLVDRVVEPDVDVFAEGQAVVMFAELPGVEKGDIEVHVSGDVLTLAAKSTHSDRRRYYREILLPFPVSEEGIEWDFRNGVIELELSRAQPPRATRRTKS